jgi:hypothetical protein
LHAAKAALLVTLASFVLGGLSSVVTLFAWESAVASWGLSHALNVWALLCLFSIALIGVFWFKTPRLRAFGGWRFLAAVPVMVTYWVLSHFAVFALLAWWLDW